MARDSVTRRRFTLGVAAAATTALISPTEALEQAQNAASSQQASTLEQKAKAAMAKLSPAAQAEVEMKVASIFRKYGDRLNDEQRADIRRAMAETQDGLEKMRAFVLENSDQPATVLKLRREGGKR
jgi:hypothetical protein